MIMPVIIAKNTAQTRQAYAAIYFARIIFERDTGRIKYKSYTFLFCSVVIEVPIIIDPNAPAMLVAITVIRYVSGKSWKLLVNKLMSTDNAGKPMNKIIISLDFA